MRNSATAIKNSGNTHPSILKYLTIRNKSGRGYLNINAIAIILVDTAIFHSYVTGMFLYINTMTFVIKNFTVCYVTNRGRIGNVNSRLITM
jgi:hypothetical protein